MKMWFLSSAFFWGGLVVLAGLSIILHSLGIRFPLFRFALGLLFLWLGLTIIVGGFRRTGARKDTVAFESDSVTAQSGQREYNAVFGSGVFDLTGIRPEGRDERVEVNAIFGQARVLVDLNTPVRIEGSAAFGQTRFPDFGSVSFGDRVYDSPKYRGNEPALILKVAAVFGQVLVEGVRSIPRTDTVPEQGI
ncbi:MAG: LiaF-related protein [bacterium]